MSGFQAQINNQPAPGEAGDFYGINPRASLLNGGAGQYVAPSGGLIVGRFAWVNPSTGVVSQAHVPGDMLGFLHRENNAVITAFLGEAVYTVNEGLPVALFDQGDFWASFANGATPGDGVAANPLNGVPMTDTEQEATGAAAGNISVTSNVATVTVTAGFIDEGSVVTSGSIPAGAALGARLTGSYGGAGTFTLVHADFTAEAYTSTFPGVSTAWKVDSVAAAGELAKISTWG